MKTAAFSTWRAPSLSSPSSDTIIITELRSLGVKCYKRATIILDSEGCEAAGHAGFSFHDNGGKGTWLSLLGPNIQKQELKY
jgi:hypothetical protein